MNLESARNHFGVREWDGFRRAPMAVRILRGCSESEQGCWVRKGSLTDRGYGNVAVTGSTKHLLMHRVMYEALVGPIPEGLELDHLCRVRACCNPWHLEPVTHGENLRRSWPERRARALARKAA